MENYRKGIPLFFLGTLILLFFLGHISGWYLADNPLFYPQGGAWRNPLIVADFIALACFCGVGAPVLVTMCGRAGEMEDLDEDLGNWFGAVIVVTLLSILYFVIRYFSTLFYVNLFT